MSRYLYQNEPGGPNFAIRNKTSHKSLTTHKNLNVLSHII